MAYLNSGKFINRIVVFLIFKLGLAGEAVLPKKPLSSFPAIAK
jgi:hypothetical protein